jgi:hypothetical protein
MQGRSRSRWLLLVAALTVVLTSLATARLAAAVRPDAATPATDRPTGPTAAALAWDPPVPHVQPPGAPQPPAAGALVGAWVKPALPTPAGRVAAVADFEAQLGRPLDVAHTYHQWADPLPDVADRALADSGHTLLLSWAGADTREVQAGRYDDEVRAQARSLRDWGRPVLLEWRWEMDRPNLQAEVWSAADYVAAWKHLRALFADEQVTNVGWVWCPLASGFSSDDPASAGRAADYFPGDDQVDWLCADTYPGRSVLSFAAAVGPFLDWAARHPHPVLIGEFGMKASLGEQARQQWLAAAGAFVQTRPQVKALVYFDADRTDADEPYDMSLRTSPGSMAVFSALARSPWFRGAR